MTAPRTRFLNLYQSLVLRCIASGNPQPTIAWFKDGRRIPGESSPLLVIQEVEISDRGVYHCTATNTLGNDSSIPAVININGIYKTVLYMFLLPSISCCQFWSATTGIRQFLCRYSISGQSDEEQNFASTVCEQRWQDMVCLCYFKCLRSLLSDSCIPSKNLVVYFFQEDSSALSENAKDVFKLQYQSNDPSHLFGKAQPCPTSSGIYICKHITSLSLIFWIVLYQGEPTSGW